MADVTPINVAPASQTLVRKLEEVKKLAEAGEIEGWALVYMKDKKAHLTYDGGGGDTGLRAKGRGVSILSLIGGIASLQHELLRQLEE